MTKFCIVVPNICGPSEWTFLYITLLVPRILRWLLDILKICRPHSLAHMHTCLSLTSVHTLARPTLYILIHNSILMLIILWRNLSKQTALLGDDRRKYATMQSSRKEPINCTLKMSTILSYQIFFMYFVNFNILYWHTYYILTFSIGIYTVTTKGWDLNLPIQIILQL